MLNILNIQYFLMLEKERNFSKAAQKLYISQQSLSNHIKNLETELDTRLFERTTPLRLTETGEIFLHYCQSVSSEHTQFLNEFNDAKQNRIGHLRLGISYTRGRIVLPILLPLFRKQYPQVRLSLIEGNRNELTIALLDRKIDIMIGEFDSVGNDIEFRDLFEDEIVMLVPDSFSVNKKQPVMQAVSQYPFLLCKSGNTPRTIAEELFHQYHIVPDILLESENMETLYSLCQAGLGITFYPHSFLSGHRNERNCRGLQILSLPDSSTRYSLKIAYLKTAYLSRAARDFMDTAMNTDLYSFLTAEIT